MTDNSRRRFLLGTGLSAAGLLPLPATARWAEAAAQTAAPVAAAQPGDWAAVRRQFNLNPDLVHLVAFFMVSHPTPVRAAIARLRDGLDANPFTFFNSNHAALNLRVKQAVAAYIGGRPSEVALMQSTTMGLSTIYHGLRLRRGDEILQTTNDHFVHHESARYVCERMGATQRKIQLYDGLQNLPSITVNQIVDRIRQAIRPRTRIVGMTWVHSDSGLRIPLRAIADVIRDANRNREERDRILLVVDGVHGFGSVDECVAETGADLFAAGTHKWIHGPRGTGIVWARSPTWRPMLPMIPTFDNNEPHDLWRTGQPPSPIEQAASFTPGGFHSCEHEWALADAFEFLASIGGRTVIANRIHELNGQLKEGLRQIPGVRVWTPLSRELSAGMLAFDIDGIESREVVNRLLAQRVVASRSPYARPTVRFSAGIMNNAEDIEAALRAVREIAAGR